MQNIIIEKPYKFRPPCRGTIWSSLIQKCNLFTRFLRRKEGVVDHEVRHLDRLLKSLQAGHGILITPNHSRNADPLVMGWITKAAKCHVYAMASWHLFNQDWFTSWAIHKMGGFSVYREGIDRQAINMAVDILNTAERPLVIFPEGAVTRTNDQLHALLDGVAFIARSAAKRRRRRSADLKVVVHPVALKYFFEGDLNVVADEVLTRIEKRLSWRPQRELPLMSRVGKVGMALLSLKELEYFESTQEGSLEQRLDRLIQRLLVPLEEEWFGKSQQGSVIPRIKALRMKVLPEMVRGEVDEEERQRRWKQLADLSVVQQISSYPPDYLSKFPSRDRIFETLERFEEDLTDQVQVHGSLKVVIDIGEAIEVSPDRDRSLKSDPLMNQLETQLQGMLDELAKESPLWE
ncbi:MAG: 1-acyl-sn-glycerol-3-phosphate acyltransferase [Pirellulaceae bacterium]